MTCVETIETVESIEKLIREEMLSLQLAAEERLVSLREFLGEIQSAEDFAQLEECEQRVPLRLTALTGRFGEVLDSLEDRLEAAEEGIIQQFLENRLEEVAEEEPSDTAAEFVEAPPPSDLVQRLRSFLAEAELTQPSLEIAQQKLILARTVLQALRESQSEGGGDAAPEFLEVERQDIADLSPIVVDLALLVSRLSGTGTVQEPGESRDSIDPAAVEEVDIAEDQPQAGQTLTPLSPGDIARFEEDYYRHVALFQQLLKTATTDSHFHELIEFKEQLDTRRNDLGEWRTHRGFAGETPLLFADTFTGASRSESHVRVKTRKKRKKKGAQKQEKERKYTSAEVSKILRDLTNPRRPSRAVGRKGNFNGKIFLTSGQINPRANKRKGDW
ncbi:hypothetical protein [Corynebacterium nasicanis]|uniref:Uncharacterized protein n=1 Tax=Corynebacterium nasicanis TaxID=1448267 RepID=A0ABW1QBU1_9CORY